MDRFDDPTNDDNGGDGGDGQGGGRADDASPAAEGAAGFDRVAASGPEVEAASSRHRADDEIEDEGTDGAARPQDRYAGLTPAERTDALVQLTGLIAAMQAELATVVVACDEARDWEPDGATDMAAWLAGFCAMAQVTARRTMRVAKKLVTLPHVHAALAAGAMSWEQVCPATRFVTPDDDEAFARMLPGYSVEQIELMARQRSARSTADANEAHRRRRFGWRPDHDAGGFRYSGFLPTDQAATVNAVLSALAEGAGPDPETGLWDLFPTRCADALHALADDAAVDDTETSPARRPTTPDRPTSDADDDTSSTSNGATSCASGPPPSTDAPAAPMVSMLGCGVGCHVSIHVDEEVLSGHEPGNATLGEMTVGLSTVRRLLCDAQRSTTVEDATGRAIGISRNAHDPPRWLRRHIAARDACCRFPGCTRQIRHLHHIRWWTRDHGPTDAPNLAGLCWAHHRLVHEGGWTITGNADDQLTFRSPTGRELTSRRQPTRRSTLIAAATTLDLDLDVPRRSERPGGEPPRPDPC